jgi:hypothetical protein
VTDPFARRGARIRWTMESWEPGLLRRLRDDLRTLLETGDVTDAAIQRFFPPTIRGDDEADGELRALIRDELLTSRLAGLDALVAVLDRAEDHRGELRVELVDDEPLLVLGVFNDVRLALGARIGIDHLERASLPEDDPILPTLALMDHLAYLQEALLGIVDPASLAHYDDERHRG